MTSDLKTLAKNLSGELYYGGSSLHNMQLIAYSTDASVYQEKPLAVAIPKNIQDLKVLIEFAVKHKQTLIPRAAGTSLAGQVVGNGIVVDISKYFNRILEVNEHENWVRVEPGVIRDDLNSYLKPFNLMFGPETSTANRAMIGGMVGNNSCGLHSMVWGSVRDHLLEVKAVLSDGSDVKFGFEKILQGGNPFKEKIYLELSKILNEDNKKLIEANFPKASVVRRNTGYALDSLIKMKPFSQEGEDFNLCKLIAGSEGTLAFITEIKLNLLPLPPRESALVCIHCNSLNESLRANILALKHKPMASELVDKYIMDFTIGHPEYDKNRFFIEGDPAAMLMVEFMAETPEDVSRLAQKLIEDLKMSALGYAYPVLYNADTKYGWEVRKAGLGLLRNLKGDAQPVNLIEDCAVAPDELPEYIEEIESLLARNNIKASYYAHAGAGEIHVEPIINLKTEEGIKTFRHILAETVKIIKRYKGSLSGEHGDGRLRGEFIPEVVGHEVYELFRKVKQIFDPHNIFNSGKIVDTPSMISHLRKKTGEEPAPIKTTFSFSQSDGILGLAQKCSGSGDCRKSEISGGVMCPSYMATRNEKDTTRARANVLRQFLDNPKDLEPLNHKEILDVMDLCISCKGCKTECPSGVDVAKMKAEFLQHYYNVNAVPTRSKLIAGFTKQMQLASLFPAGYNFVFKSELLRRKANKLVGFHPDRTMPLLGETTLYKWFKKRKSVKPGNKRVYLFCDEFTNFNDVEIGKKTVLLLEALGFEVEIPQHEESGRIHLSKGFVKKAKEIANKNISLLGGKISAETPLIGIEPSAILTFRDEYLDLASTENLPKAISLSANTFTIEEFLAREASRGTIDRKLFTAISRSIHLHGHCYQKALSSQEQIKTMLSIPINYSVSVIPSGCCGMAGSFGYEEEHFEVSNQIGELVLFPAVRKLKDDDIIAASGTSCRHQIKDGTYRIAKHPVEILWEALIK